MKQVVLIYGFFFLLSASVSRAGSVITLAASSEFDGKLSLDTGKVHVEGASPTDINLSDVLEADFTDTPFQLDYFTTNAGETGPLPANWKAMDFGQVATAGKITYADGTLALSGEGADAKAEDKYFFAGRPWTGDGQWTVRVKEIDGQTPQTEAGLMLRDGMDASSSQINLGATAQLGSIKLMSGPMASFRWNQNFSEKKKSRSAHQPPVTIQLPVWLRMTGTEGNIDAAISGDGKQWNVIGQCDLKSWAAPWIGFFLNSHLEGTVGKAVLDQVSFTPAPGSAQVLPAGVLLRSGSFLAGAFEHFDLDPDHPEANGIFLHMGKTLSIPRANVAAAVLLPAARSEIAEMSSQVGVLMKNGDFLAGTPESLSGGGVTINSVLLGIVSYKKTEARACVLQPPQLQPSDYEVRLKDGSSIRASSLNANNGLIGITEVSGINLLVPQEEIAEFRAGTTQVQSLLELPWKATVPPPAKPAPAAPDQPEPVQCWTGNNQEQVMVAQAGTTVEFPLTGKFRAMAMRVGFSPDTPPNAQAIIRILADGREVARTPFFRSGDQPHFIEVTLQQPKTVALEADSSFAGTKLLFIDPVVIR